MALVLDIGRSQGTGLEECLDVLGSGPHYALGPNGV